MNFRQGFNFGCGLIAAGVFAYLVIILVLGFILGATS